jgi:hypothetical protein
MVANVASSRLLLWFNVAAILHRRFDVAAILHRHTLAT